MRRSILIIAVAVGAVLMTSLPARAGDAGQETPFVSLGAGARSLGMGGAYSCLVDDATSIHYNPAGLTSLDYQEFAFMHSALMEGSIYDFAAWAYPINENHGIGAGLMRIGTDNIIRRVDFADRGRFSYSYTQVLLSYGRKIIKPVSAGMTLQIFQQSLDSRSDFGMGLDVGLRIRLWKSLNASLVAHDLLQHDLVLLERPEKTNMVVVAGLGLQKLTLSKDLRLALDFDAEKQADREYKARAGGEVTIYDVLSLRGGYDRDNLSLGVGFKSKRIRIDYAYKFVDYTDGMHHISLSFLLGMSTSERIRQRELAKLPPEPTAEEKQFAALMENANRFFRRFQLDSASYYFSQALKMQPGNEEIIGTLAAIEESRRVQAAQEEALRAAREDVQQTLHSFVAQAEQMLDRKMYRAALDLLSLIFDIDPGNAEANALRDRINQARGEELAVNLANAQSAAAASKWSEAVEAYNRILEIDPENADALQAKRQILTAMDLPEKIRMGITLFEKGELIEARSRFEGILSVNPNDPTALDYLKRIRDKMATRPPATLEDLQKDRVYWELYLEGLRHMRNKEYQRAIEVWEKVLEAYPNNANTLNNIEQARLRLGTQAQ